MKKIYLAVLLGMSISLASCRKTPDDIVVPRPTWKLRSDIFLSNKILLGAQATEKRLILASTRGFFQMDAADTSFIKYTNLGGGALQTFGGYFFSNSLFAPLLSNRLYAALSSERKMVAIIDVFDTRDSTSLYSQYNGGGSFYIPTQTGIASALGGTYNPRFGSYNELTKTLLYTIDGVQDNVARSWGILMSKKENSPYFSYHLIENAYRSDTIGRFAVNASIAIGNYFVVSPSRTSDTNPSIYIISAKTGSIQKNTIGFSLPSTYFLYKNHLYGYSIISKDLLRSDDGGLTWRKVASLNGPSNFAVINGNLVSYDLSQVFWIDDGNETFSTLRELTNEGLEFSQLTGLAEFNNKVFAATLSGLYVIDTKDFFTLK